MRTGTETTRSRWLSSRWRVLQSLQRWQAASCLNFVPFLNTSRAAPDTSWGWNSLGTAPCQDHCCPLSTSCQLARAKAVIIGERIVRWKSDRKPEPSSEKQETFGVIQTSRNKAPCLCSWALMSVARRGLQSSPAGSCAARAGVWGKTKQSRLGPILTQPTLISKNSCCLLRPFLCLSSAVAMECKWKEAGSKNPAGK